jgi:hypothetical protein
VDFGGPTVPIYFQNTNWIASLWPLIVAPAIVSTVLALLLNRFFFKTELPQGAATKAPLSSEGVWISFYSFSILGIVTGYMTGMSREPAIGAVLPAVLSLVGGLTVYVISKEAATRKIIIPSLIALSGSIIIGALWGATERSLGEQYATWVEEQKSSYESLIMEADKEWRIRDYRRKLGLPETAISANTSKTESPKN